MATKPNETTVTRIALEGVGSDAEVARLRAALEALDDAPDVVVELLGAGRAQVAAMSCRPPDGAALRAALAGAGFTVTSVEETTETLATEAAAQAPAAQAAHDEAAHRRRA
ncbi:hypothetical protein [Cellulomonas sp. PhB143]|uniref:hypothetical protein n=1 Tax=Cellulomonas sp. PhB143 TaxID=2485186 RepID=UPI000F4930EF|nr:hypothetical protein [Cellulomonas sp. PhB143]ROS79090.1 hypothetical protein EDF32_0136 [Cellulomonas sp. PhB143]